MNFKFELQTFLWLQCALLSLGLHVNNRTLKKETLVTLDVLGSPRDRIVVDLESDRDSNVEEEIQIETHECPPCLCLLDNDRDNYFVDNGKPTPGTTSSTTLPTTSTTVEQTTTTTTPTTTTTATPTTTTTTTTTSTTTTPSTTTPSPRSQTAESEVCLSESCVMAAGNLLVWGEWCDVTTVTHWRILIPQAQSWPRWTGARTRVTTSTSTRAGAGRREVSPSTWTGSK